MTTLTVIPAVSNQLLWLDEYRFLYTRPPNGSFICCLRSPVVLLRRYHARHEASLCGEGASDAGER